MPEKWNSSADKYERYATPRTAKGSTTANGIRITDHIRTHKLPATASRHTACSTTGRRTQRYNKASHWTQFWASYIHNHLFKPLH
jgi:hypothetical protein